MGAIAYCKIFPSIGIARVGDSPDAFFVGPESPSYRELPLGGFKDSYGRIKRQGARFRVYAFDEADHVVCEMNLSDPKVRLEWGVELANTKASWYRFDGVGQGMQDDVAGKPERLRNKTVTDRRKLEITPSAKSISGIKQKGQKYTFDDGSFFDEAVYLGELQTDDVGRLIVLGGRGLSSKTSKGRPITNYANNNYWHDDISDGPVNATVHIDGRQIPVKSTSWVIVTPPKFAPTLINLVTLYDVLEETCGITQPVTVSFARDIYPLFERASQYQWVNAMSLRGHGPGKDKTGNFLDPTYLESLSDNSAAKKAEREAVFGRIRNPNSKSISQANYTFMPLLSGDEGDAKIGKPDHWLYLLKSQYAVLEKWAAGEFESDWDPKRRDGIAFPQLRIGDQPEALTRAALEYCVGGPFYPGIEMTYVARYKEWFEEPFRFKQGTFRPGDMTKRMAVPWQADFYECNTHWWPAQRPDDVLNVETYRAALADHGFSDELQERRLAGSLPDRISWDRGIGDADQSLRGDNEMVDKWKTRGFVVPKTTPAGEVLYVEEGISRYDFLKDRDYFFYLLNLDSYPDFLPKAKQLAEKFISDAAKLLEDNDPEVSDSNYQAFDYTPEALGQRLDEIYVRLQIAAQKDPLQDPDNAFHHPEDILERIRQYAPLNQLDGAWIRNIAHAGPIDRVTANVFDIWMDEMGDGNPDQNHCNVYTQLLAKVGLRLDPIYTRDYADNPETLDSAFTVPMYELAISQFTPTFFPEILGMTLQLEWEVLSLVPTIKLFQHFGFDPHFYELHVGIDNAADGHGAKARQAVEWYLDEARARGGDAEVQALWKRIWTGYVAFGTTGTLYADLDKLLKQRVSAPKSPAVDRPPEPGPLSATTNRTMVSRRSDSIRKSPPPVRFAIPWRKAFSTSG